jgi:hypothetical protein
VVEFQIVRRSSEFEPNRQVKNPHRDSIFDAIVEANLVHAEHVDALVLPSGPGGKLLARYSAQSGQRGAEDHMSNAEADTRARGADMKLEVVVIPVSDVDRAKRFYGGLGWRLDADYGSDDGYSG